MTLRYGAERPGLFAALIILLVAAVTGACETAPLPTGTAAYAVDQGVEYLLGPGDRLRINVYNETQLSGDFAVANNGSVAVPLIGEIKAGGMTPTQFQSAVEASLAAADFVKSPRVTVNVIEYRPFYILGEINKPGQYQYSVGLTLTKAVATAGGFTYRADMKVLYLTREGSTSEQAVSLTAASLIGPGDTIRVSERNF
jgi:polysaccharide export outer membrane protein